MIVEDTHYNAHDNTRDNTHHTTHDNIHDNNHGKRQEKRQEYKIPGGPTQPEIVAIVLSKLEIKPGDLVADIGCGTGTVTAALAQIAKTVFAIDTREEAICCTGVHCLHSGCSNVCLMQGDARSIIKTLDRVDRAFCGGSKGIDEIITLLYARGAVRIVVNAVLLETVMSAMQAIKENGMVCEIIHLQISRSTELALRTMFVPINPVYIITGTRVDHNS